MRLLLKLSGEVLGGRAGLGLDPEALSHFADTIAALAQKHEVAIVTGGGNIMRGKTAPGLDRAKADQIGMMATVVNCM
ncbi:MAG: UMP kinase, partial [Bradymonadales bacterium]|nr:UMP kinase [Bradymonadales bacterium]